MVLKNRAIAVIIALPLIVCVLYILYGHMVVLFYSKLYGFDITYKSLRNHSLTKFEFGDLKITDRKRAMGLVAKNAKVEIAKPLVFNLTDVQFISKGEVSGSQYGNLAGLISAPFRGQWVYKEISGMIEPNTDGIHVSDFTATSDEIMVSFSGDLHKSAIMNSRIKIYFSKSITDNIPDDLSRIVLNDEEGGWKSLSASLSGDYNAPSINVSSKLFRLNIKAKEAPAC